MPTPLVIDTDPGIDDALAILLALASPEVELKLVTTVHGNVELAQTTENALRVLHLAGRSDVPVAAGDDPAIWSAAAYGKGSLGFLAIRQEIGAAAFETALHDLATRYAWGEMTPDDLRAAFETASGQDLDALWSHWFDEAAMTQEEIEEIAAAFAG